MKLLSIINYPYYRPGGGLVTMRALYHQLARRGHRVVAVHTFSVYSPAVGRDVDDRRSAIELLEKNGVPAARHTGGALRFADGPVDVHYADDAEAVGPYLDQRLHALADQAAHQRLGDGDWNW